MLFKYKAVDQEGKNKEGEIDAPNRDMAISGLQRRGLVVISIKDDKESKSILSMSFFEKVSNINMVKVGEETGKLNQTFLYLAEYLDRQYALTSKTRNALIYPVFVVITFFV